MSSRRDRWRPAAGLPAVAQVLGLVLAMLAAGLLVALAVDGWLERAA